MKPRDDLPQKRARFVMSEIEGWRSAPFRREAVNRSKSLPVQVRCQGLTVSLAVLLRENSPASLAIAVLLATWLLDSGAERYPAQLFELGPPRGSRDGRAFLAALVKADRTAYLAAQHEALQLLDQLKLLADALYGEG